MSVTEYSVTSPAARNDESSRTPPMSHARATPRRSSSATTSAGSASVTVTWGPATGNDRDEKT
jgi:hypothetical protein